MKKSEMEIFIEEMSAIGDDWTLDQVKEVYGDKSLDEALEERRSLVGMHLGNISSLIGTIFR